MPQLCGKEGPEMSGPSEDREKRLTLNLYPETKEMIRSTAEEAQERSDLPNLSMSQVGCYMIEQAIEEGALDQSVEALIPEEMIECHRVVRERERIKARTYVEDLKGGWRGRAKSALNARLAGEEPYEPRHIRVIAQGYRDEASLYWSGEELRRAEQWLDDRLSAYIDGYRAKQAVPDPLFEEVDDVEVGRDLWSLRERAVEVVETIEEVAEAEAYDPDAILDRFANDWGVSERALRMVIDWMTEEDTTVDRALKAGDKFRLHLPDRALSDGSDPEVDPDRLMTVEDPEADHVTDDMGTAPLQIRGEEALDSEESEPEIDAEALEDMMPEEVAADD
jgi:hypothetical protein